MLGAGPRAPKHRVMDPHNGSVRQASVYHHVMMKEWGFREVQ